MILPRETVERLQIEARSAARLLRLPFRRRTWRGLQGNWQGAGSGSSLDFQDHRPYSPGDDPRHINWQAYARSGQYTMKLYRQEVSPSVDLLVDLSESMFFAAAKAHRVAELVYWTVENALQSGASLRCHSLEGSSVNLVPIDEILGHTWMRNTGAADPAALGEVPWRHGALRIFLSDLLWPGDPQGLLHALCDNSGIGVVLAPFCREEAEPDWHGNLEMIDCESRAARIQRVDSTVIRQYRAAYERHFGVWEDHCLRHQIAFARIAAEPALSEALRPHVASSGAVEWAG